MNWTLVVLGSYLVVLFSIAAYLSRRESVEEYFLNARSSSLVLLTCSNVTTLIGAAAIIATVSEVYETGISYGLANFFSLTVGALVLGSTAGRIRHIGGEFHIRSIPEFFGKRFDRRNELLAGLLQFVLLVIWTGIQAVALATLATTLIGIEYHVAIWAAAAITIIYTAIGGLKIDIITDFIQFWVMAAFFAIFTTIILIKGEGISSIVASIPQSHLNPFAFGGVGWIIGAVLFGSLFYIGNTVHWQRVLSAKDVATARWSFFLAAPIIALFLLATLIIGLFATSHVGVAKEHALFSLMSTTTAPWLYGLGLAAILAVIMSTLDSLFVGGSTILYHSLTKKTMRTGIRTARSLTALFGIFGFSLALFVPDMVELGIFTASLGFLFIPPAFAGLYSQKISADASFWSLLVPSLTLFTLYPFLGKNTFLFTSPMGILILLAFDPLRRLARHNL